MKKVILIEQKEASSLDRIKMTEFWSDFERKFYILGHVQKLTFVVVNFLVMFTDFGHIHLATLIRSSE